MVHGHGPSYFASQCYLRSLPSTFSSTIGQAPMPKRPNLLKQMIFDHNLSFQWQSKTMIPLFTLSNQYAPSQIYTFSKTKLFCGFTRSGYRLFFLLYFKESIMCKIA